PGEDAAHDAVLVEVLRLGEDVGPDVEHDAGALEGWHDGSDARPADALEEALEDEPAGDHRPGVAGADDAIDLALSQLLPAAGDGVVGLLAEGLDGRLLHRDDLGAVEGFDARDGATGLGEGGLDLGMVADEDDAQLWVGLDSLHRAGNDRPGG